jgi:hypothetical protein
MASDLRFQRPRRISSTHFDICVSDGTRNREQSFLKEVSSLEIKTINHSGTASLSLAISRVLVVRVRLSSKDGGVVRANLATSEAAAVATQPPFSFFTAENPSFGATEDAPRPCATGFAAKNAARAKALAVLRPQIPRLFRHLQRLECEAMFSSCRPLLAANSRIRRKYSVLYYGFFPSTSR